MAQSAQNQTKQQRILAPIPWQMHLIIGIVGIIIIGIVAYGFYTGDYLNRVNAPLIDAAMEIKYETTTARLLMEQIVDGDIPRDIEQVWEHFDECSWYVQAMLDGGTNLEGTFLPVKDEKTRRMVESLKQELIALRERTISRVVAFDTSDDGTTVSEQYDEAFSKFIAHADAVEDGIQTAMVRDLRTFRITQGSLIVICLAMLGALWMLFHRFDRLRAQHVLALHEANWNLEREITERKYVETALEEERDRAQRYLDIVGVIVVVIDTNLQISMLNKKGCEVLECLPEEVIGKDWVDNFVPSEKRSAVRWELERTLRGEIEPISYIENPVTTRKGNYRLFGWHTTVLQDNDGSIVGLLGSGDDITERILAEAALMAKEENYRTIFNSANDAIFVHSWETGTIVDANTKVTELYGYTLEEVLGLGIEDISSSKHPFVQAKGLRYIEEVRKGHPQIFEWLARDKDGNAFWVEVNLKRALIAGNNRILAVVRDIGERKRAEEELQRAYDDLERRVQQRTGELARANDELQFEISQRKKMERALVQREKLKTLGAIAAEVAHEIRNPLVCIGGFSRRLKKKHPDLRECDIILQESMRLEKILDRIRDYLSPVELRSQQCSVNAVITNCMELLAPEMESKGIGTNVGLDPHLPLVSTDSEILTEVVINIIRNAVAAMAEGETLNVDTKAGADDISIIIKNRMKTSKTIDPELLFLPFDEGGESIGMPFCYKVLREMGGVISFEQEKDTVTFTVTLPAGRVPRVTR